MLRLALFLWAVFVVEAQQNPSCQRDWTYFAKTNKCFKVFGGDFDSVRPMSWSRSEEYCNTFNGGHLASFHSDEEITFVVDLTHKAHYDDGNAGRTHIGLRFIGNHGWEWTDGSSLTYTKWWIRDTIEDNGFETQNPVGVLHTRLIFTGTMWIATTNDNYAFACQSPPTNEG